KRMRPSWRFVLIGLLLMIGPRTVQASRTEVLPVGSRLHVRTTRPIVAASSWRGMKVSAIVDRPVAGGGGRIGVPRGSLATPVVVDVPPSTNGRGGRVPFSLKLQRVPVGDRRYAVATNHVELKGPSEGRGTAGKVAGGAGIGAAAGGLLGGGTGAAA